MKLIDSLKNIISEGLDDKWVRDDVTVTLKQLLDVTEKFPVKDIPIDKVKDIVLNWDDDKDEHSKVDKTDLKYPVLIIVDEDDKLEYILDGNHRVQKAIKNKLPSVKAKLIKISQLPKDFQFVFGD